MIFKRIFFRKQDCCLNALGLGRDPISFTSNGDPFPYVLQNLARRYAVGTASLASSVNAERSYKSAVEAFKLFCWVCGGPDPGNGHFPLP